MAILLKTEADYESAKKKRDFLKGVVPMSKKRSNMINSLTDAIDAFERRYAGLKAKKALIESGYAGLDSQLNIVDRRIYNKAQPIPAGNGAPESKPV